ncbi:Afadin and alpha-actinin-binding-domain-containing protein [Dichotomopilus funicola]|uniref:Afadin and alpha-actinin-binding-domain-containing protein n=1 Tax=Dichotomopilus funicola TaxID=1934379 RepID=A0AAN6V3Y2_9PEZI|nr:Afadin and alpha-actinin-binding-domain-containing protein [Dichotomopilus funicola]
MIESENLRTASLYINNQLLSRGLLRDGHGIDFAQPGESDAEVAETMSRIMAVVNDLILRRDRDAEHRESLSTTLRTLRAESLRQANDIQRLQEKYADAQRKVGISEAAEAALRTNLKSSEATVHRLKEEASRTKTLVAQTRASCANEVRKRDRQIEGLKKAVTEAGRARGAGKSAGVTSITVVGEIGSEAEADASSGHAGRAESGCDLRTETNAFLAELAKGLSEENEGLLQLVRRTTEQLKDMSGWDAEANGHFSSTETGDGHALVLAAHPADMSLEVEAVLDHLRTILTNPSFVPIEEVVVREDEIHRLRDGWEKMETRWKEAVHLIDGWRKRMQASGRPVNVEELKMGLRLSPVKVKNVEETTHGYALRLAAVLEDDNVDLSQVPFDEGPLELVPHPDDVEDVDSDVSSLFEHEVDVDELDVEEPNVEILQQSVMLSSPTPAPPQVAPLQDSFTAMNRRERPHNRRPPKGFPTIDEERTRDMDSEEPPLPPPHAENLPPSPSKRPILSLRTVPPEEAANVELPPSAHVSTPDASVGNNLASKPVEERTSKTSATAAAARPTRRTAAAAVTRTRETTKTVEPAKAEGAKRDAVRKGVARREMAKKKEAEEAKPVSKTAPVKGRPPRPPVTRGRADTRPDEKAVPANRAPRANSAASATSARSVATNKSTIASKASNTDHPLPPPPQPETAAPSPSASPSRSPKRVNSRLPLPRPGSSNSNNSNGGSSSNNINNLLPAPQQSPLSMATITAKLAASERDADATRVRAKLKAARLGKAINLPPPGSKAGSINSVAPTEADAEVERNTGPGARSTRSESDSMAGTASTSASTSDGRAPPSSTTTREDIGLDDGEDEVAAERDGEDADELGFSPPLKPATQKQKQKQEAPTKPATQKQPPSPQKTRTQKPLPRDKEKDQPQLSSRQEQLQQRREQREQQADEQSQQKPPVRKREKRTSMVASRRRSTLQPWELDALIQGGKEGIVAER